MTEGGKRQCLHANSVSSRDACSLFQLLNWDLDEFRRKTCGAYVDGVFGPCACLQDAALGEPLRKSCLGNFADAKISLCEINFDMC